MAENVGGIVWTAEMKTELLVSAQKIVENSMAATGTAFEKAAKKSEEASKTIASSSKAASDAVKSSSTQIQAAQQSLATATKLLSDRYTSAQSKLKEFVTQQVAAGRSLDENGNVTTRAGVRAAKLSEEYNKLRLEFQAASKQVNSVDNVIKQLSQSTEELRSKTAAANPPVKELATAIKMQEVAADTLASQYTQSAQNLNEFIAAQIRAGGSINETGKVLNSAGNEVVDMTAKLDRLTAEYAQNKVQIDAVNATFMRQTKTAEAVVSSLGGLGRNAGQAGIQIQQFVGQIQGGVSPMVALSQQGADLGFVLGVPLLGAVVSIAAAIGGMLFSSLNKTAAEIKDQFLPNIEDLRENLDEISKSQASIAILQIREELDPLSGIARNAASQVEYLTKQIEKYPSNKDVQEWNKELLTQQSVLDGVNQRIIKLNEDQTAFQAVIKRNIEGTQGQQEADKRRIETISDLISATEEQAKTVGLTQRGIALYVAEQAKASEADLKRINAAYDVIEAQEKLNAASKSGIKEDNSKAKALDSVVTGLDEQYKKLTMTTDAYEEYAAVQQAEAANATPAQIAAIREKVKALQDERAAVQANVDLQAEIAENVKTEETEIAERGSKVDELMQEINLQQIRNQLGNEQFEIESAIRALGHDSTAEDQQAIADKVTQLQALRFEYELLGATIQESMQGVALNAMDQFSAGLARVITEGDSAREMFGNLAKTIATELLTAIIRYWVGQAAAAIVGQTAVAGATITAGGAAAAAWAPAATLASIATLGGAATVGVAALGAGLTAGVGLSAAAQTGSALSAGAGRKNGGPVNSGMIYPVSEGGDPELLMQGGRSYLLPGAGGGNVVSAKDMQVGGSGSNAPIINISNYSGSQASVQSQRFSEQDKRWVLDVVVGDMNKRGPTHKAVTGTTNAVNRTS